MQAFMATSTLTALKLEGAVPPTTRPRGEIERPEPDLGFDTLERSESWSKSGRGPAGTIASILAHLALVSLIVMVPLLLDDSLPETRNTGVRTFFAQPLELAPPPPPPPPPAVAKAPPRVAPEVTRTDGFVAPVATPELLPESGLDLGIERGVSGGVEGGVPGGVIGGLIGGLPDIPLPTTPPVRVGGRVKEPTKLKDAAPVYPDAAVQARIEGVVVLECLISPHGKVTRVNVLRGMPLLDTAAVEAARQWVYTPTLMDGVPVPVIMTVTVRFDLRR